MQRMVGGQGVLSYTEGQCGNAAAAGCKSALRSLIQSHKAARSGVTSRRRVETHSASSTLLRFPTAGGAARAAHAPGLRRGGGGGHRAGGPAAAGSRWGAWGLSVRGHDVPCLLRPRRMRHVPYGVAWGSFLGRPRSQQGTGTSILAHSRASYCLPKARVHPTAGPLSRYPAPSRAAAPANGGPPRPPHLSAYGSALSNCLDHLDGFSDRQLAELFGVLADVTGGAEGGFVRW